VKLFVILFGVLCWLIAAPAGSQQALHPAFSTAEGEAVRAMSGGKSSSNPHLEWTPRRPPDPAERRHAEEIILQLRAALKKYKDYRVAEQEGYRPLHADADLAEYHFTNDRFSLIGSLWFRPSKPTSLIYRKTRRGYELIGALFTASRFATAAELHRRVPLSVARWHAHRDICMPPTEGASIADWTRFGFRGTIATEQECAAAGGTFYPEMFGWLLRVYPFEKSPEKIWAH
jgi:hypothetical protein